RGAVRPDRRPGRRGPGEAAVWPPHVSAVRGEDPGELLGFDDAELRRQLRRAREIWPEAPFEVLGRGDREAERGVGIPHLPGRFGEEEHMVVPEDRRPRTARRLLV